MSQFPQPSSPPPYGAPPPPPPQGSGWGACLIGCAVFFLASLLICGGISYYVYVNTKSWATDIATSVAKDVIRQSEMREEDKQAAIQQIDRVGNGFKEGKITLDDVQKIMQELMESPLMSMLLVYGVEQQYINPSGLTDEEKQTARRTVERLTRGVIEKKIVQSELEGPLSSIMEEDEGGNKKPKEHLTDDELRQAIDSLKKLADEKGIPDEPYQINVGEELKRIVDEAVPGKLP